jgi:hypothetical protein
VGYVHLQTSLDAAQTISSKCMVERKMLKYGRIIVAYRADNGIFADNDFKAEVLANHQAISYCGIGVHHQNGIAVKHIGNLSQIAHSMLLHTQLLWPEVNTTDLWSFVMCLAHELFNLQDRLDGLCYIQCLSQSTTVSSLK